mgnify:CR=1 FL=1
MNNIVDMLQGELREYKSRKLFGIFLLGKRVSMKSGSYTWQVLSIIMELICK